MTDLKKLAQEISRKCIASQVRQLNRSVTRIYDDKLRSHGLKITQFTILVAIANLEAASPQIIGSTLNLEKSTTSRGLERMIEQGWLLAEYSNGGRIKTVTLTEVGQKLLTEASHSWSQAQEQVEKLIEREDLAALFKLTKSINY